MPPVHTVPMCHYMYKNSIDNASVSLVSQLCSRHQHHHFYIPESMVNVLLAVHNADFQFSILYEVS